MKKFTLFTLLLTIGLSINVAAQKKDATLGEIKTRPGVSKNMPATLAQPKLKLTKVKYNADVPEGQAMVTLAAGNVWGDGSGYQMLIDADATAYGAEIPAQGALTAQGADATEAVYGAFEYKIPENADGSRSTTNIILHGQGSVTIPAGIYDFVITNPTPGDRIWIPGDAGTGPVRADNYEFKSKCEYTFTMVLVSGSGDGANLEIYDPDQVTKPTNLTVTPAATSAYVYWTSIENEFNLRYREYVNPALTNRLWDLDPSTIDEQIEGWRIMDHDNDGQSWGLGNIAGEGQADNYAFVSSSWNSKALTPDNWLVSPEIKLGGTVKFEAWGLDPSYSDEVFKVYVLEGTEWGSIDDFIELSEDITATGTPTEYSYNLSAYEGMGVIAIRHYNCTDQFRLVVDNFAVTVPDPATIPEWTIVPSLTTNEYTINGLNEETEYEVCVQGIRGRDISPWTDVVRFVTKNATGINTIGNDNKADSKDYYTLTGQKVNGTLPAGIYIHNGKKIIVK